MKKELIIELSHYFENFCGICGKTGIFHYHISKEWWQKLIPLKERKHAVCLECLFRYFILWIKKQDPTVRENYENYFMTIKISTEEFFVEGSSFDMKLEDWEKKLKRRALLDLDDSNIFC